MNILLINHYAGSPLHGMEYRPYYMAQEWVKLGHEVTIVAASFSHLRQKTCEVSQDLLEQRLDGIRYVWLKTPSYRGNGAKRVVNMMTFVGKLFRYEKRLAQTFRPDVVISSSTYPLDNLPARRLALRCGAKLVYEVHDLWPLTPIELGGMSRWNPFIMLMQWAEDFACRKADRIVSMLPNAEDHFRQHGMTAGKFAYVPNGVDLEEWTSDVPAPAEHVEAISRLRHAGRIVLGYLGGHALSNALDSVLDAASLLQEVPVAFVLVGQGVEKAKLQERAASMGLANVHFLPPVSKKTVPCLLAKLDVCILAWARSPLYRFGVCPNKLLDYMMAAKPVIHAIDAANDLVQESQCGISIPPEDPAAFAEAVRTMISLSPANRAVIGQRGRDYVVQHHDYAVLASRFLDAIA